MFWGTKDASSAEGVSCSFCEASHTERYKLIAGPEGVHICNECVGLCNEVLDADSVAEGAESAPGVPPVPMSTNEVTTLLLRGAPGQDAAIASLTPVLVAHRNRTAESQGRAARVLLVGPRGSGKSHLARSLLEVSGLPGVEIDLNRVTATGYIGEDIENVLNDLVVAADNDSGAAQRGVLVLDGLHHLATIERDGRTSGAVGSQQVQRHLLRVLGGSPCSVGPGYHHPGKAERQPFDPTGVLCVMTATTELPSDPGALRSTLLQQGLMGELLARIDILFMVPRPEVEGMEKALPVIAQRRGVRPFSPEALRVCAEHAAGSDDGLWALERLVMQANLGNHQGVPVQEAEARALIARG